MTVKEWAAEYRRINEWEQQERLARLPQMSVEESVQDYFRLCRLLLPFYQEADAHPGLQELRLRHYEALFDKWRRLASLQHDAASS